MTGEQTGDAGPRPWSVDRMPAPRGPDVLAATPAAGRLNPPAAVSAEVVPRRLHEALGRAVAGAPLTVVTGPTGSGKTVLAAAWARAQAPRPVAWLDVGPAAAGTPSAFWASAVAALRRAGAPLADLTPPVRGRRLPSAFTVRLADRLLALPSPVVLVIDHADTLTRPDTTGDLDLVAGAAQARLRLVLLARADPLLPLVRERTAGRLAEIRADDLAFTPDEVEAVLGHLGTPVTPGDAAALAAATGGRAVTLPLVAALLRRGVGADRLAAALDAADSDPAQHLLGEVLAGLPVPVRAVLLRSAVAAELWPGLVAAVTGRADGLQVLDWLATGHVAVEKAPGAPGGLRIPALLRELLVAELAFTDPDAHLGAHRGAARWHAAAARLPQAVKHAVAAGDWTAVAALLVDDLAVAALLARSGPPEADLLDVAGPRPRGPDAALLHAAAALGRTGAPGPAAARAAATEGDGADRPARSASAALVAAAEDVATGRPPERALAAIVTAQARTAVLVGVRPERRAECAAVLGTMRASVLLATDADDATLVEVVRAAEHACAEADADRLRAGRLADLALLQALAGRLTEADSLVADHEALCEERDVARPVRSPAAATAAAWICVERGQTTEARRWVAVAREGSGHRRAPVTAPLLTVVESRRLRLAGQFDAAERALTAEPAGDRLPRWVREQVLGERVRLRLAVGDASALRLLDDLPVTARTAVLRATAAALRLAAGPRALPGTTGAGVPPVVALEAQLLRAELLIGEGDTAAAVALLREALHAAEPDGLRRPFLDALPGVRRALRTHPGLATGGRWLLTPHASPVMPENGLRSSSPAPLSDREREALALLAAGLSTAGIAATMGISTNSARGHLRSILRKLSAADRADAVRRGQRPDEAS